MYKQGSPSETSGLTKKNPERSEKFKGKHSFPVKSGVRRSTIPKPSILTKPPWGSGVSDGFVMKASSAQTKVDGRFVVPRKSVKTNPKFKPILTTNKLIWLLHPRQSRTRDLYRKIFLLPLRNLFQRRIFVVVLATVIELPSLL